MTTNKMSDKYLIRSRAPFASAWTKAYSPSLITALETAWRKHTREWSIADIAQDQGIIFNREELVQAFTQMDDLTRDHPKRPLHEITEQIIKEMGKAEIDEE